MWAGTSRHRFRRGNSLFTKVWSKTIFPSNLYTLREIRRNHSGKKIRCKKRLPMFRKGRNLYCTNIRLLLRRCINTMVPLMSKIWWVLKLRHKNKNPNGLRKGTRNMAIMNLKVSNLLGPSISWGNLSHLSDMFRKWFLLMTSHKMQWRKKQKNPLS